VHPEVLSSTEASDAIIAAWTYPEKDAQRGSDHDYTLRISSNAENCPELRIQVRIRYK